MVVEYKGGDRVTTDDTKEKRNIGELWAANSGGTNLFLMAEKKNAHGRKSLRSNLLLRLRKVVLPALWLVNGAVRYGVRQLR